MSDLVTAGAGVVGALIALAGVVSSRVATADELRRGERRDVISLRRALVAELRVMERLVKAEKEYVETNDFTWIPQIDAGAVYRENLKSVGRLEPTQAEELVAAHGVYRERFDYMLRRGDPKFERFQASGRLPTGIDLKLDNNRADTVNDLNEVREAIRKALTAFGENAKGV